jgi:DNA-binding transcriptional LysR family regulator
VFASVVPEKTILKPPCRANLNVLCTHINFGMLESMDFSERIGRRLKLQDLHVLMTVAQAGSMGIAAKRLNSTQPAVSRTIAELESTVGVRLFNRSPQGVEPTACGRALLHCSATVFDDLRQGVRNIEFLNDPTLGEIRIGADEPTMAGLLSTMLGRLHRRYPGITVHMAHLGELEQQHRELRERRIDLVIGRLGSKIEDDVETQILYEDSICVVMGSQHRRSSRRTLELSELANEPWGFPSSDSLVGALVKEAFRERGISLRGAVTGSNHLLLSLLPKGPFLVTVPASVLTYGSNLPPLKILPVELPVPSWSVGITTLKDRTISPVAQLFLECAREAVGPPQQRNKTTPRLRPPP